MLSQEEYVQLEVELLKCLNQFSTHELLGNHQTLASEHLETIVLRGQSLLKEHDMDWNHARDQLAYFGNFHTHRDLKVLLQYRLLEVGYLLGEVLLFIRSLFQAKEATRGDYAPIERSILSLLCLQSPHYCGAIPGSPHYSLQLPNRQPDWLTSVSDEEWQTLRRQVKIEAKASGSVSLTSDCDITVHIPSHPEYEVDFIVRLHDVFRERFGNRELSVVFDTNVYPTAFLGGQDEDGILDRCGEIKATATSKGSFHNLFESNVVYSQDQETVIDLSSRYSMLAIRQYFGDEQVCEGTVNEHSHWQHFKQDVLQEMEKQVEKEAGGVSSQAGSHIDLVKTTLRSKLCNLLGGAEDLYRETQFKKCQAREKIAQALGKDQQELDAHQKMRAANDLYENELCMLRQCLVSCRQLTKQNSQLPKLLPGQQFISWEEADPTINRRQACLQGIETQSRALVFAPNAYFSVGSIQNALHPDDQSNKPFSRRRFLQTLLMNVGYKLQYLSQHLNYPKDQQHAYQKIGAIATAKYGVRLQELLYQLSVSCPDIEKLCGEVINRVQPTLKRDVLLQWLRKHYQNTPHCLLHEANQDQATLSVEGTGSDSSVISTLQSFNPQTTIESFIEIAVSLTTPLLMRHCLTGNKQFLQPY